MHPRNAYVLLSFLTAITATPITDVEKRDTQQTYGLGGFDVFASGNPFLILDGGYTFDYQNTDGNLVVYDNGIAKWSTGATHSGCSNNGCTLTFQSDGNFVAYAGITPFFNTGTAGRGNSIQFRNYSPYIVIHNSAGQAIWTSG